MPRKSATEVKIDFLVRNKDGLFNNNICFLSNIIFIFANSSCIINEQRHCSRVNR